MPTHASFFSGVGGLDLGLERAGWRTVSFSEIDPYACAVLAQRWPGVPNLGNIVDLADRVRLATGIRLVPDPDPDPLRLQDAGGPLSASLWTGGFPCQDLSVAGKRRGFTHADGASTRSGLAFAFLDLVGVHRPRFVLLENVPGLLSSHGGRDMAALIGALVELGYGVGYRVLDARHFGVPQRRRRVFILGVTPGGRAGAEFAAEVLSVGSRCRRHPPTGIEAGEGTAGGVGVSTSHALTSSRTRSGRYDANGETFVSASPDPRGVRAPDGLAGRSHDRDGLADTLRVGGRASGAGDSYDNTPWVVNALDQRRGGADDNEAQAGHLIAHYRKSTRAQSADDPETWVPDDCTNTLNGFDVGDARTVELIAGGGGMTDDPLLPPGLDSHRYRCCGNGVVADVAYWIGLRLAEAVA
jgi:DNA-cytosine methyltransferase